MTEQTERLKQLLPTTGIPEFMTYRSRIWNKNKVSCFVMMVKAKAIDIPTLEVLFESIKDKNSAEFISWDDWTTLIETRQNTIINNQVQYHTAFSSLIISEFIDNDEIIMGEGLDLTTLIPANQETAKMTITEFLGSQYMITRDNESVNIAAYVYPPSLGTREILVEKSLEKMAIKWCKVIKSDLYRNMSDDAKAKSFKYLNKIKDQVEITRPWTPNKLDAKYSEAEIDITSQKRGQKRSKNSTNSNSYANAVKSNSNGSPVQVVTAAVPSSQTITSTITHDVDSDTVKELKQQILKLEAMVTAATTNSNATTTTDNNATEIANDTVKELKDHIAKLEERQNKTDEHITTIESVTKSTNEAVAATQQSLAETNKLIEINKNDMMQILLRMEESQKVAQLIANKQFADYRTMIMKIGNVSKDGTNDENKMDVDPKVPNASGGNQSNCDGRSALGSVTNF